jgi:hypothetical protein
VASVRILYRPLGAWPGEAARSRKPSPFRSSWPDTIDLLDRELWHLGAREAVLQLALDESEIRRDGFPRANARPRHPGVAISFESRFGPLRYATDTFSDWQANVRAIALGLEALRKVDRYGITKRGEQYAGWKALPAPSADRPMRVGDATAFLAQWGGRDAEDIWHRPEDAATAYRRAASRLHPDAGGTTEDFQRLQEAKRILDAHHGRREGSRG